MALLSKFGKCVSPQSCTFRRWLAPPTQCIRSPVLISGHQPSIMPSSSRFSVCAVHRSFSSASAASAEVSAATASASSDKADDDKSSSSWGRVILHIVGGITGVIFLYYFRKSGYNAHDTELLFLARVRELPFYPAPGPKEAQVNSSLEMVALPQPFTDAFAEWFVATDLRQAEGVTREDVLELAVELGFSQDDKACKVFIDAGEGSFEESRRLSGVSLQESLLFLETLALPTDKRGKWLRSSTRVSLIQQRIGQSQTDILKSKCGSSQTLAGAATAMQQAWRGASVTRGPREAMSHTTFGSQQAAASSSMSFPSSDSAHLSGQSGIAAAISKSTVSSMDGFDEESEHTKIEIARLKRIEESLLAQLERRGSLSPAEEARLQKVQTERARLLQNE